MVGGIPERKLQLRKQNQVKNIKGLSAYQNHKTLGHYKTPNGSQSAQYKALKKKATAHAAIIQGNHLTARETYIYYSGMYLPSMTYPLANSALAKQQLHLIEKAPLNTIISKVGMCNKTS